MKIYQWYQDKNKDLPQEYVWLPEDSVVSTYEYEIKWDEEHNPEEPRHIPENERNHQIYDCTVFQGTPREHSYKRMTYEKKYPLYYHESPNIETFLKNYGDEWSAVAYIGGHFFLVGVSDL